MAILVLAEISDGNRNANNPILHHATQTQERLSYHLRFEKIASELFVTLADFCYLP
jgi:hypothetical protein